MERSVTAWRVALAAIAAGLVALHLAWEVARDGIVSHHFLADPSMPAISNAWGLLWLPLLAALYAPSIRRRAMGQGLRARWRPSIVAGLMGGLVVGGGIAFIVTTGLQVEGHIVLGTLLGLALLFPVWRGETVLGFLTGMMVGIGAILPTVFAFALAAISLAVHRGVVPGLRFLWRRLAKP